MQINSFILDLTWLPWLQANTGIVTNFLNPILRLETFLVTLALIMIFFRNITVFFQYANKVRPTLDLTLLPWLRANTGIVNDFLDLNHLGLVVFLVSLAFTYHYTFHCVLPICK